MTKKQSKIPKNVELTSIICSYLDSVMNSGEKIGITNLTKALESSKGEHPHVHTIERFLQIFETIQKLSPLIKLEKTSKGRIKAIEKIEPNFTELNFRKDTRQDLINLKQNLVNLKNTIDTLTNEFKSLKEEIRKQ